MALVACGGEEFRSGESADGGTGSGSTMTGSVSASVTSGPGSSGSSSSSSGSGGSSSVTATSSSTGAGGTSGAGGTGGATIAADGSADARDGFTLADVGVGMDALADRADVARDALQETMMCTPGTKCGPNLTKFCNQSGMCVECLAATDCQNPVTECTVRKCDTGICKAAPRPAGDLCNMLMDQCDGAGNCIDCVNSGGCGECCVCSMGQCIPASK